MKIFKYGLPLAALAMLASCSNDNVSNPADNNELIGESAYLNVSIAMPNIAGNRAGDYVNGVGAEYAVNSSDIGYLLIFDNTSEVFLNRVNLTSWTSGLQSEGSEITDKGQSLELKMEGVAPDDYKALIILNPNGIALPQYGETFTSWSQKAQQFTHEAETNTKYLTMTSALGYPFSATNKTNVGVLTPIASRNFYYQESQKADAGVVNFYVARVAAKVSLAKADGKVTVGSSYIVPDASGSQNDGTTNDRLTLTAWDVELTNSTAYPVQTLSADGTNWTNNALISDWGNIADQKLKRFISGNTDFIRVNWGVDPNYNSGNGLSSYSTSGEYTITDHETVKYINENTFDLLAMDKDKSTRVVFKGKYTVAGQTNPVSFVEFNGKTFGILSNELNGNPDAGKDKKLSDLINGEATRDGLTASDGTSNVLKYASEALGIDAGLAKVNFYKDGDVYYAVIIRHFDDTDLGVQGSFRLPTETSYVVGSSASAQEDTDYMGRYGVVRNNWYELSLNSVAGPGSPTPPEPGDTPDDDPDPYKINCTINILSWTKRSQDVTLK